MVSAKQCCKKNSSSTVTKEGGHSLSRAVPCLLCCAVLCCAGFWYVQHILLNNNDALFLTNVTVIIFVFLGTLPFAGLMELILKEECTTAELWCVEIIMNYESFFDRVLSNFVC